jgi:hypothetical protein
MAVILLGSEPRREKEPAGIVVLNDGQLTGGDTVLAYTGTYFQNGERFSASVRTQWQTPGQPSVFGIDNLDLTLTGKSTPPTASCTGTAKQAPADFAERSIFYKPRFGIAT